VTFQQMISTLWQAPVIRRQLCMKLSIDSFGELTWDVTNLQNSYFYTHKFLVLARVWNFADQINETLL
jgi:hypothetical protein